MTKLIVLGAAGRTGRYIVDYALATGYDVTAFIRSGPEYPISHPSLNIVHGDAVNAQDIDTAIKGHDIVISALGTTAIDGDAVYMMAEAMTHILATMDTYSIKRVLAIGGLGVLQANDTTQLLDTPSYPAMYHQVGLGHNRVYQLLKGSHTDWTFICCPYIPDAPRTEQYQVNKDYPALGKGQINTGDLADFIVKEMTANQYLATRVGISN
jgi:uncharacterized protein